ncbi:hypothetical protein BDAP_001329 [Binucleata daphniae]
MDNMQDANIERMTSFIQLEAQEKANEIKIKAIEDYNTEKAKLVRLETQELESTYKSKRKEIEIDYITKVSEIKIKYNMLYIKKKYEIINKFMYKLHDEVRNKKLEKELVEQCMEAFNSINDGISDGNNDYSNDYVIYCLGKDRSVVNSVLNSAVNNKNIEIKELDERMLGGVIFVSRDGKKKCDNSYLTRCEVLYNNYLNEITSKIYEEQDK